MIKIIASHDKLLPAIDYPQRARTYNNYDEYLAEW